MRRWSFAKGHGTHNDFVVLLDRESMLEVGPSEVRFICDRRGGIGADGLLRAVLAKHIDGWTGDGALWFMDYRNADGSIAEMCGNGLRVFIRFLLDQGLVNGPAVRIATRSGLREATLLPDGRIRVSMGSVAIGNSISRRQYGRRSRIQGRDGRCRQSACREFRGQSRRVVASCASPMGSSRGLPVRCEPRVRTPPRPTAHRHAGL